MTIYYRFYTDWWADANIGTGWCHKSVSNWNDCITEHSNVLVSVFSNGSSKKLCGTLHLSPGLTQNDQIYTILCHSEGDAVRLHKFSASGRIVFADIVVDTDNGK